MESLVNLYLTGIGIQVLLSSIGERCTSLISICLINCFILNSVEIDFGGLKHLKDYECAGLRQRGKMTLDLFNEKVFHHFTCGLQKLYLKNCCLEDGEIPINNIGELSSLQELDLSYNNFSKLHFNLSQLTRLKLLKLYGCKRLVELPELPSSIAIFLADNCDSLTTVRDFNRNCKWLCVVSIMKGNTVIDGNTLLQSMLEGKAIENHSMRLELEGLEIAKEFRPHLRNGVECRLQLPENWCNDYCGFLMCAVLEDDGSGWYTTPWITMKQATGGSMVGMDYEDDDVWEESVDDNPSSILEHLSLYPSGTQ